MSAITSDPSIAPDGTRAGRARIATGLDPSETQAEPRPAVARPLERHRAAMRLRDVLHDREAQARAWEMPRLVRSPEAIEHARGVLGGHAGAVIAHRDLALRHRDLDQRPRRTPLRRVVHEVRDGAR